MFLNQRIETSFTINGLCRKTFTKESTEKQMHKILQAKLIKMLLMNYNLICCFKNMALKYYTVGRYCWFGYFNIFQNNLILLSFLKGEEFIKMLSFHLLWE